MTLIFTIYYTPKLRQKNILLPVLTLWGRGADEPQLVCFCVFFSYLINFCRQWHLCEYLILGDLSTHLLGLVFSCLTSAKMRIWVPHSIKVGFFKSLFFKKLLKNVAQAPFVYVCVYTSTGTLYATWPFISRVKI